jgi:6-phosphogluconolactonase
VAMDPLGRFVYVVNVSTGNFSASGISVYRIAANNGALTPVAGSPFLTGESPLQPFSVAVDPLGQFIYVVDGFNGSNFSTSGNVWAYRIAENGVLTPIAGSPFPEGFPASVVVSP